MGVGAAEEYWDPATDADELTRSRLVGGGSLPCSRSLLLPLALEFVVVGGALLLVLPWRSLGGSILLLLEAS